MQPALMRIPILVFVVILAAGKVWAQDPVKVAPKNFKVVLENDHVRVLDFHSKAGDKIPMHSHPGYVAYSITGSGKTTFTFGWQDYRSAGRRRSGDLARCRNARHRIHG